MAQVLGWMEQVPKQGEDLRRISAFHGVLVAQVQTLFWDLRRIP